MTIFRTSLDDDYCLEDRDGTLVVVNLGQNDKDFLAKQSLDWFAAQSQYENSNIGLLFKGGCPNNEVFAKYPLDINSKVRCACTFHYDILTLIGVN